MVRSLLRLPRRATLFILLGAAALIATIVSPPRPRLVWNASASAPIGLYRVEPGTIARTGEFVIARVSKPFRNLAARRRYIPVNVPLVKRVAAEPGDTVCALGREIFIDGRWITERQIADGRGRPMPWWSGCERLRNGALFLLMDSPDSFDGRYFGPIAPGDVIGRAIPLWTR